MEHAVGREMEIRELGGQSQELRLGGLWPIKRRDRPTNSAECLDLLARPWQ
jgi:hypothetical protein